MSEDTKPKSKKALRHQEQRARVRRRRKMRNDVLEALARPGKVEVKETAPAEVEMVEEKAAS